MRKYHVYGIGNALVDSDIHVDEAFLQAQQVEKNVMTLTDEATHRRLLTALAGYSCHSGCGGSAANTMIAFSQFGGRGYFSCKVADDAAGRLFLRELNALNLDCNLSLENLAPGITGQCLVLVTEDAQRSMNTHLGISEAIQAIDTVGAGDMFAGAYLYAITHGYAPQQAVELANKAAGEVVSQYGARLSAQKVSLIKDEFIACHYSVAKRAYSQAILKAEQVIL